MMTSIPFNKPYLSGNETAYIIEAVQNGKISGDGIFTKKCHDFFERKYAFKKCLLTTSCTDALEMAAILLNIQPGDEVIMPSYTFVSTANAFVLRGARIIFCDSRSDHPGMNEDLIEDLINEHTRVIVPVHYAGVACNMEKIMGLAKKYNLFVVEDAAQAVDSHFIFPDGSKKPLGGIGHMAAFSFHETKNVIAGEGGMLVINDEQFFERAEIVREKGTNRNKFFRGEVDKYAWVDIGSSFLPSEIIAAFLFAQLENIKSIQQQRLHIWNRYYNGLKELSAVNLPVIPAYAENNGHIFYILCNSLRERSSLIEHLKSLGILSVFHYLPLHQSPYYTSKYSGGDLPCAVRYSETLLRLPLYYELTDTMIDRIINGIKEYFDQ